MSDEITITLPESEDEKLDEEIKDTVEETQEIIEDIQEEISWQKELAITLENQNQSILDSMQKQFLELKALMENLRTPEPAIIVAPEPTPEPIPEVSEVIPEQSLSNSENNQEKSEEGNPDLQTPVEADLLKKSRLNWL